MQKTLYTIGYEGTSLNDLITTLKNAGVEILLDIRFHPYSRRPGFSKTPLSQALIANGIQYVHLPGLGNPRHNQVPGPEGYKAQFEEHMQTDIAQHDLTRAAVLAQKSSACLLCYERKPEECHRNIVADYVSARTGQAIHHLHVVKGGAVQQVMNL